MTAFVRFVREVAFALSDPLIVVPAAGAVLAIALAILSACQFVAAWEAAK